MGMITNFTHSIACWHGKDVLRLSWKYQGKDVRAVLMAKNGARYIPVKAPRIDPDLADALKDSGMVPGNASVDDMLEFLALNPLIAAAIKENL